MWEADGILNAVQKFTGTGIDPADFVDSLSPMAMDEVGFPINYGYYGAEFSGSFDGDGSIYSYVYNEQVYTLLDLRIGVFSIIFDDNNNVYDKNYYYRYDDAATTWKIGAGGTTDYDSGSYWYLGVTGNWNPDGTLDGVLKGARISETSLTTLIGELYGIYNIDYLGDGYEEGYWIGSAAGYVEEKQLAWSSWVDAKFNYFVTTPGEPYGCVSYDGASSVSAIMGAVNSPFANMGNPTDIVMVGEATTTTTSGENHRTTHGTLSSGYGVNVQGYLAGSKDLADNVKGILAAIFIDEYTVGTLTGEFNGVGLTGQNTWYADGSVTATARESNFTGNGELYYNNINGIASGLFGADTSITMPNDIQTTSQTAIGSLVTSLYGNDGITPLDWGVYNMVLGGYFEGVPCNDWTMVLSGSSWQDTDTKWIASVKGDQWSEGLLSGDMNGVWLKFNENNITAGSIKGKAIGDYIEVTETTGTWNAVSAGEWVEATDLLTADKLGFDAETLQNFVSGPITEVYSSNMLQGINGPMSATANISLYQNQFANIWTMLINGKYAAAPIEGWNLQLGSGNDTINLQNGTWIDGKWTANVTGTVGGNTTTGQAGGTYGNGAFTGVGAGTWKPN